MALTMVVGFATGVAVADKHRQEMPVGAAGLGMRVSAPVMRRSESLGEVEGNMDRHQRVERERK